MRWIGLYSSHRHPIIFQRGLHLSEPFPDRRVTYTLYIPSQIESTNEWHRAVLVVQYGDSGNCRPLPPSAFHWSTWTSARSRWNKPRFCKSGRMTGLCACVRARSPDAIAFRRACTALRRNACARAPLCGTGGVGGSFFLFFFFQTQNKTGCTGALAAVPQILLLKEQSSERPGVVIVTAKTHTHAQACVRHCTPVCDALVHN